MIDDKITEEFRNILRRLKLDTNSEKYNSICNNPSSDEERRVWELCEKFWSNENNPSVLNIDEYKINNNLDYSAAKRDLAELKELLDKLGWDEI